MKEKKLKEFKWWKKQKAEKCHSRPFIPVTNFVNNQSRASNTSEQFNKSYNKSSTPINNRFRRVDFEKNSKDNEHTNYNNNSYYNSHNYNEKSYGSMKINTVQYNNTNSDSREYYNNPIYNQYHNQIQNSHK